MAGALRATAPPHATDPVRAAGAADAGEFGRWVAKDDMAEYLRRYAQHHGIVPRFRTEVRRVERDGGSWTALTATEK